MKLKAQLLLHGARDEGDYVLGADIPSLGKKYRNTVFVVTKVLIMTNHDMPTGVQAYNLKEVK